MYDRSVLCLFCRSPAPTDGTLCRKTVKCRMAAVASTNRLLDKHKLERFYRHAKQCIENETPPDNALFDNALDLVRLDAQGRRRSLDRQHVSSALGVSVETVRRWEEGSSRPRPLARLSFMRYALNMLENEGRLSHDD